MTNNEHTCAIALWLREEAAEVLASSADADQPAVTAEEALDLLGLVDLLLLALGPEAVSLGLERWSRKGIRRLQHYDVVYHAVLDQVIDLTRYAQVSDSETYVKDVLDTKTARDELKGRVTLLEQVSAIRRSSK